MKSATPPPAQGLYDPRHEHDACGVGFVVDLEGPQVARHRRERRSRSCCNLEHRGACGCEKNTGDGAGILMQMPHRFLARGVRSQLGITLPAAGRVRRRHGLPAARRRAAAPPASDLFEQVVREEGQTVLGWRDVPTDNSHARPDREAASRSCGRSSSAAARRHRADDDAFERKLYVIRKRVENAVRAARHRRARRCSTSRACRARRSSTRACSTATSCTPFYPDLRDPASSRRWPWSTRASAPTPSPPGPARIRTATSPTTARSTRCAATSTGCTPARACSRSRPVRRRHRRRSCPSSTRAAATRRCSTTCWRCWCSPAGRCRTR